MIAAAGKKKVIPDTVETSGTVTERLQVHTKRPGGVKRHQVATPFISTPTSQCHNTINTISTKKTNLIIQSNIIYYIYK